jgi:hypothetical protein
MYDTKTFDEKINEIKNEIKNETLELGKSFGDAGMNNERALGFYRMNNDYFSKDIINRGYANKKHTGSKNHLEFMLQLKILKEAGANKKLLDYVTRHKDVNINRIILAKRHQLSDKRIISLDNHVKNTDVSDYYFARTITKHIESRGGYLNHFDASNMESYMSALPQNEMLAETATNPMSRSSRDVSQFSVSSYSATHNY